MLYKTHISTAVSLLSGYNGRQPLHIYLRQYFAQNKKHGSKDRKNITSLCYNYFRLGKAFRELSVNDRMLVTLLLSDDNTTNKIIEEIKPEWNELVGKTLSEKLSGLNYATLEQKIFPYSNELSKGIDGEVYNLSFLRQPKLYIRIRPGNKKVVSEKFAGVGITFEAIGENCLVCDNSAPVNSIIDLDAEAVVQDYNSQKVGELMKKVLHQNPSLKVWDCCAASGGKSIMAYDIEASILLTVSDKRETILKNLTVRFKKAGISNFRSFIADLSKNGDVAGLTITSESFNFIIADVPCTGSGTWGRTPEQLYYFNKNKIAEYSELQKKIVSNVIPYLPIGGYLLYITCSVFRKENEDVVQYIREKFGLQIVEQNLYKGYERQSDTMFAALFIKAT